MSIAVADKEVKNHIKEELEAEAYAKSAKGKAEAAIKEQEEINQAIIEAAKTQLGVPYVWGGITPRDFDDEGNALNEGGLDCSSLVQYCYRQIGIETGRTTWDQYDNAYRITSIDEAEPGDILFRTNASGSSQHVSIYVGNGQYIHAPRRNTVVQYGDDPYSFQKCLKFTDDVPYYLLDELEEEK